MNPFYYTPTQAAALLGISRRTIYHWMDKGLMPYKITPSGRRLIQVDAILKNPEKQNDKPNPDTSTRRVSSLVTN